MRCLKIVLMLLLAVNVSFCTDAKTPDNTTATDKQKLLKTINVFNKAFQDGNLNVLDSLTTDDYTHTNGNSKAIGKKRWFAYLSNRANEIKSGNLDVIDYKLEEREIYYYGDMAIVTGKVRVTENEKGAIRKKEYRITNVWVNTAGNWKRAGFHDGKIE